MQLNSPSFPTSSTNPSLSDKALGVIGGLVKLMTFQQIKNALGVIVEDVLNSTSETNALSAKQGKALSDALANKLDTSAYNEHYKGTYANLGALQTAHATSITGSYAIVDAGTGQDANIYIWDVQDGWILGGSSSLLSTDALAEGSTSLYFTESRVRIAVLTGISFATGTAITAADSVLSAFGKLQKQITDILSNYATIANQRYQFIPDASSTYAVPASAVTENGRNIIELSNNALTSITVNTSTATGKTAGDYVYVSITGTYAAQILVASGVTLQGDLTFSYQHQTKCLIYKGSDVWKVIG